MLDEMSKIFGRDFTIGFFVPSLAFLAASIGVFHAFGMAQSYTIDTVNPLKDVTFLALVTFVVAFCLMALNRIVFRTLEGYWPFELGRHLNYIQRLRFRRLHSRLKKLTKEKSECQEKGEEFEKLRERKVRERNKLMGNAAQRFPSKEGLVLPTAFGNTVRAFEDYPRVMYGFESINGWSRLNAVMATDFREAIASMRAITDLWVNLWFLSVLVMAEYLIIAGWSSRFMDNSLIFVAGTIAALLASRQARMAAEQWGEWVKAAFDVFLPDLCLKLGYKHPKNRETEHELWYTLSQAFVYRNAPSLGKLVSFREDSATELSGPGVLDPHRESAVKVPVEDKSS